MKIEWDDDGSSNELWLGKNVLQTCLQFLVDSRAHESSWIEMKTMAPRANANWIANLNRFLYRKQFNEVLQRPSTDNEK